MPLSLAPKDRLTRRTRPDPVTGCHEWTGPLDNGGYGSLRVDTVRWLAHRLAWTLHVGPIPDGLVIDHLCRNPRCINITHLEPVTQAENLRRSMHPNFIAHLAGVCSKGHALTEENTSRRGDGRARCRLCVNETARRSRANAAIARGAVPDA